MHSATKNFPSKSGLPDIGRPHLQQYVDSHFSASVQTGSMIRKRAIVRGRVQGVGFRWSARAQADRLGVTGFARNLPDGTVEVEAEGSEAAVEQMLHWLHHGPRLAEVHALEVTEVPVQGSAAFDISAG